MKKIISLVLLVTLLLSLLSLNSFAAYSSEGATTIEPVCDGVISANEYKGAMIVNIDPEKQTYYWYNAACTVCMKCNKSSIEARGSKMIDDSKIYVLPTETGLYFAFDIADTTYGGNYVRDIQWHDSAFHGDAVHVTIKNSSAKCNSEMLADRDAIRISVAPFQNDYKALGTSIRTVKIISGATANIINGQFDIIDTTGLFDEACKSDESGYVVEFLVSWEMLSYLDFNGPVSYKNGEKLYFNFAITDSMGKVPDGGTDWAIFQCAIDSGFNITQTGVVVDNNEELYNIVEHNSQNPDPKYIGDKTGFLIEDGTNWCSYTDSGKEMKLVVKEKATETQKESSKETTTTTEKDSQKQTDTKKESKKESKKETHIESRIIEKYETNKTGDTVLVTETETILVEDDIEETETETEISLDSSTEKDTKKESVTITDNSSKESNKIQGWQIAIIVIAVLLIGGAISFIIIKKKKN